MRVDFPDDPVYWNNKHKNTLADVKSWVGTATDLIDAAMLIRPTVVESWKEIDSKPATLEIVRVHGVYLMLTAYAAENITKAIIIRNNKLESNSFEEGLPSDLRSHDLSTILGMAGIAITPAGEKLCARLSSYTYWAGRYPAPLKAKFFSPETVRQQQVIVPSIEGCDLRVVERFLKSLYEQIEIPVPHSLASICHSTPPESWESRIVIENIAPWGSGTISGRF